jgi:hypothetical protein
VIVSPLARTSAAKATVSGFERGIDVCRIVAEYARVSLAATVPAGAGRTGSRRVPADRGDGLYSVTS